LSARHTTDSWATITAPFSAVEVVEDAVHEGADGRRCLVAHGDVFDMVVKYSRWLALLDGTA
jgi:UDP-2,3-diacylglucosamine pyrophosphatase LpxH